MWTLEPHVGFLGCWIGHLSGKWVRFGSPLHNISEISRICVYSGLPSGEFASLECISEETGKSTTGVMMMSCSYSQSKKRGGCPLRVSPNLSKRKQKRLKCLMYFYVFVYWKRAFSCVHWYSLAGCLLASPTKLTKPGRPKKWPRRILKCVWKLDRLSISINTYNGTKRDKSHRHRDRFG